MKKPEDGRVSKAEFVGLMVVLGMRDRVRYRKLRETGWLEAIPQQSDYPN